MFSGSALLLTPVLTHLLGPTRLPMSNWPRRSSVVSWRAKPTCTQVQSGRAGMGEAFIRLGLCRVAIVELEHGMDPAEVAKKAIDWLGRSMNAAGGIILTGREGDPQAAFNTPAMPWAKRVG